MSPSCDRCLKPKRLCVCESVSRVENRRFVLILQHPQEPDRLLGSARLAHLTLARSSLQIGLSWRGLGQALRESGFTGEVIPSRWAVLYLGSERPLANSPTEGHAGPLRWLSRKGDLLPPDQAGRIILELDGWIALDGTWSQAKTLWWRNSWLLKLRRVALRPAKPSSYGSLRKEPRRECLSTLEAIAHCLDASEDAGGPELRRTFQALLARAKGARAPSQ